MKQNGLEVIPNPKQVEVDFTIKEIREIHTIAHGWMDASAAKQDKRYGSVSGKGKPRSDFNTVLAGALGPYAFRKYTGIEVDLEPRTGGDPGWDAVCHGNRLEIKTYTGLLAFEHMGLFKADIAVLINFRSSPQGPDCKRVWIQGWIWRDMFENLSFKHSLGHGERLCVQPISLNPIDILIQTCETFSKEAP